MRSLPAYLAEQRPIDGRTYGVLKRNGRGWIIEAEPHVIQLALRLFPGSQSIRGVAHFPASPRLFGDLNWLLLRYPLEIVDRRAWRRDKRACVAHTLRSLEIARQPASLDPPPGGFAGELREFQRQGLAAMVHHPRMLLADEMGLGKTVQFLALLATVGQYPALIVVQAHLLRQWAREIERFLPGVTVATLNGLTPDPLPKTHVHLIHYGLLRGWKQALPGHHRVVCFDEVQELRHTGTQKYSAASLLAGAADWVIGLSGTPIHNYGGEIWAVLNIIELQCLGDWGSFTREWCSGYGEKVVCDPETLGSMLREQGLLLRRTKAQVLSELPPKRRIIEEIDADAGAFGELLGDAVALVKKFDSAKPGRERGRAMQEIVESVRQATGIAKAPQVALFVTALLEAGETVLVCAHHHRVVDILLEGLSRWSPAVVTGRESKAVKDRAVERFQQGETPLCIISMRVCSGLNLQAARCVVFAELDWSPAVHSQAEDRAHRMGQEDSVLAYYLVWPGALSSDPDILARLGFKTSQFKGILGDPEVTEDDKLLATKAAQEHMLRIVARLRGRTKCGGC